MSVVVGGGAERVLARPGGGAIEPLAAGQPGRYSDGIVTVARGGAAGDALPGQVVRTEHFVVRRDGGRVEVRHWLRPEQLDNDLAGVLCRELFEPGWLGGAELFERVFTGVVRSCAGAGGALEAWTTFYANTLARIRGSWDVPAAGGSSIAEFAPVYREALRVVGAGSVLDLGSCFGFWPLLLAGGFDREVIASDVAAGTMRLLGAVSREFGLPVTTIACDAARVPFADRSVETVTAIHLLEHLEARHGAAVLGEALRVARGRVVVAVPFEDTPAGAYGHVRCFDRGDLIRLGAGTGREFAVWEHHGGWLVVRGG